MSYYDRAVVIQSYLAKLTDQEMIEELKRRNDERNAVQNRQVESAVDCSQAQSENPVQETEVFESPLQPSEGKE